MEVSRVPALSFTDICSQVSSPISSEDVLTAQRYSYIVYRDEDVLVQLSKFAPELAIIVFLRTFQPNVNLFDRDGQTPLFHAIERHHHTLLNHLLDMGANFSDCNNSGILPVHFAVKLGSSEALAILVNHGCNVDVKDKTGKTPLHYAMLKGIDITNFILQCGADTNVKDNEGQTPLHYVAGRGLFTNGINIDMLVQNGAYVDARDRKGRTPLHEALALRSIGDAARLLSHGANPSVTDDQDQTPLKYALWYNSREANYINEAICLVQKYGADVSALDLRGETLLHWSLGLKLSWCVLELVYCGADISKPDRNGYTPIWWAIDTSPPHIESIQLLIDRGANIHDPDQDGYTLLHRAVEKERLNVVKVLLDKGASGTTVNKNGQSPLDLAFSLGFNEIGRRISLYNQRLCTR